MRVLSLFSGVGGMDMGLERAGHTIVGMCEIDKQARQVLRRHWPNVPLWKDVTNVEICTCFEEASMGADHISGSGSTISVCDLGSDDRIATDLDARCANCKGIIRGRVDLVAGGSPCQDLSVAGKRAGLDGQRSGLFWHQCRVADSVAAPWVLWENVAGAFSSNNGADFAAVLWGITGALPVVPDGGWRNMGICIGPKRTAVWRLLDAQWFGVAQRRRRIFVVGGPTDGRWLSVLLESESSERHTEPSRASRQAAARTVGGRTSAGGWTSDRDGVDVLTISTKSGLADISPSLDTGAGQGPRRNQDAIAIVGSYRGDNINGWREGVGPVRAAGGDLGGGSETLTVLSMTADPGVAIPIQDGRDLDKAQNGVGVGESGDRSYTLDTTGAAAVAAPSRVIPIQGTMIGRSDSAGPQGSGFGRPDGPMFTLERVSRHAVSTPDLAVRRLTPVECERLMSYPDDWTRWADDGSEIADSHRYKMCGNGVVSNVAEWIGERLGRFANDNA